MGLEDIPWRMIAGLLPVAAEAIAKAIEAGASPAQVEVELRSIADRYARIRQDVDDEARGRG